MATIRNEPNRLASRHVDTLVLLPLSHSSADSFLVFSIRAPATKSE